MKRSAQIATPLVAAAALSILSGCRPKEMQRCVDETGKVVPDSYCAGQPPAPQPQSNGHGGFVYLPHVYRPYYGGTGGFQVGNIVGGGSFNAASGVHYASPLSGGRGFFGGSGTSRGGFGDSFGGGE